MCYSYTSGYRSIHWCIVHLPGATPLKKTNSPSPSSYQLPMAPELWLLLHVHLPSPCWDCFWIELMQVLWMLSQPLSVQTYNYAVVSVNAALLLLLSLSSLSSPYTTSGSYSLVFSLFCNDLWALGEGHDMDAPFRAEHFIVSYPFHLDHFQDCVNWHLLHKEFSLMCINRCSDLWVLW